MTAAKQGSDSSTSCLQETLPNRSCTQGCSRGGQRPAASFRFSEFVIVYIVFILYLLLSSLLLIISLLYLLYIIYIILFVIIYNQNTEIYSCVSYLFHHTNKFLSSSNTYAKWKKNIFFINFKKCLLKWIWQLCLISFTVQLFLLMKCSKYCSQGKDILLFEGTCLNTILLLIQPVISVHLDIAFPFFNWGEQV